MAITNFDGNTDFNNLSKNIEDYLLSCKYEYTDTSIKSGIKIKPTNTNKFMISYDSYTNEVKIITNGKIFSLYTLINKLDKVRNYIIENANKNRVLTTTEKNIIEVYKSLFND